MSLEYYRVHVTSVNIELRPVASGLYPVIKFGTATGAIDAFTLASAINFRMGLSVEYRNQLAIYASEGIVLNGINAAYEKRFNQKASTLSATAVYPGYNIGNGVETGTHTYLE